MLQEPGAACPASQDDDGRRRPCSTPATRTTASRTASSTIRAPCKFDVGRAAVQGAATPTDCLTAPQVESREARLRAGEDRRAAPSCSRARRLASNRVGGCSQPGATRDPSVGHVPIRRPPGCQLGCDDLRPRSQTSRWSTRRSATIVNAIDPDLRDVQGARRQAAAVSRLGRPGDPAPATRIDYYNERAEEDGREAGRLGPPVHGAGDGTLRRRTGPESGRLRWARSSAGARSGMAPAQIAARAGHGQPSGHDAAAVPVSAGGAVQGRRQHQRRRELRLQGPLTEKLSSRRHEDTKERSREKAKQGFVSFVIFVFS